MSKKPNDKHLLLYIVIAFVIIIAIIALLVSFGKIDFLNETESTNNDNDLSERKLKLEHRHKKLKELIERKKELRIKLQNKFRWIYFWVRFGLLFICATYNFFIWKFELAKDLGTFLNYNEVVLLILFALNFLFFKNLIGLKEIIDYVKNIVENRVYKKYIKIEIQIDVHSNEAVFLETELQKIEDEIKLNSNVEKLLDKV